MRFRCGREHGIAGLNLCPVFFLFLFLIFLLLIFLCGEKKSFPFKPFAVRSVLQGSGIRLYRSRYLHELGRLGLTLAWDYQHIFSRVCKPPVLLRPHLDARQRIGHYGWARARWSTDGLICARSCKSHDLSSVRSAAHGPERCFVIATALSLRALDHVGSRDARTPFEHVVAAIVL